MAMNRSSVIYLVKETHQQNDYGVIETTYTPRKVYADVTSVSSREWFDGGRNGLNPEYRMTMFFYDYSGEEIVEYNGVQYAIYRTYEKGDLIELYVQKKQGVIAEEEEIPNVEESQP